MGGVRKKKTGRSIENQTWDEMPKELVLYRRGTNVKILNPLSCDPPLLLDLSKKQNNHSKGFKFF
jgi:hypothetical protein